MFPAERKHRHSLEYFYWIEIRKWKNCSYGFILWIKCSLQFDKKYVYDQHLSLAHGQEFKVKTEPTVADENFEEFQQSENVYRSH